MFHFFLYICIFFTIIENFTSQSTAYSSLRCLLLISPPCKLPQALPQWYEGLTIPETQPLHLFCMTRFGKMLGFLSREIRRARICQISRAKWAYSSFQVP